MADRTVGVLDYTDMSGAGKEDEDDYNTANSEYRLLTLGTEGRGQDYNEVDNDSFNRWYSQFYFREKPLGVGGWRDYPIGAEFWVYPDDSYYTKVHDGVPNSQDPSSDVNVSVGIGLGFGPIKAGVSFSLNEDEDAYYEVYGDNKNYWDIDYSSWPIGPETANDGDFISGVPYVQYDVYAHDSAGNPSDVWVESVFSWYNYKHKKGYIYETGTVNNRNLYWAIE